MNWAEYVSRLIAGRDQDDVADDVGVSQGTLSRWVNNKVASPEPKMAVRMARACNANPLEALVVIGLLHADELNAVVKLGLDPDSLTSEELIEAVARRLDVSVRVERRGA